MRGLDSDKDQSYVLHGLTQRQLIRTIFPLGHYKKSEVRDFARQYNLPMAERPDSQDLCFVGQDRCRDFLKRNAPEVVKPGVIKSIDGEIKGEHQGLAFYTIGQRKGLRIPSGQPFYVIEKVVADNSLIIGTKEGLGRNELTASQVNWISGDYPTQPFNASAQIRYKSREIPGKMIPLENSSVHVKFSMSLPDITPGQSVVIYDGEICLGGGVIQ